MVFTKDTKIREITQHPSFRGFGHLLFPLQLAFHPEETVQDVTDSNHFIWYSNLKTKTSLEVLNNLLERAQKNEQINDLVQENLKINNELNIIKSSRGWKAIEKIRNLRNKEGKKK